MKKINWISRCRILWWILLKKDLLENIKSSKSFLDPENYQCCHQEPYNFFSIFFDFWTLSDNSGIPKSVDSKPKISCNRVIFFPLLRQERFLEPIEKNPFFAIITGESVSATISIALFRWLQRFIYFFFIFSFVIDNAKLTCLDCVSNNIYSSIWLLLNLHGTLCFMS